MAKHPASSVRRCALNQARLTALLENLISDGYSVLGPRIRDGAIAYGPLKKLEDLPIGWSATAGPGHYRLHKSGSTSVFGTGPPMQGLKQIIHPPEIRLFAAERENGAFRILDRQPTPKRLAFFGVRPCDLAALKKQDRVLLQDQFTDPVYKERRREAFLIAVNCTEALDTCFCDSMECGPSASSGFDIVLNQTTSSEEILFAAEAGSERGGAMLDRLEAPKFHGELSPAPVTKRTLETRGIKELLYNNFEHPRWDQTAGRCLSCANCTMVCPTCFCVSVEDSSDVTQHRAERWRRWDSCFTQSFTYIHGGSVRLSPKSRYRQWLTHKLAAWQDQFGESGCTGCGRCITWCPVGIDITEEAAAIRGEGKESAHGA